MPGISIEFVLADLPSKSSAFTRIKHESRQVDTRPATYIPCHDTSPPMHQVIRESSDEAMLYYVQRMKINSKAKQYSQSIAPQKRQNSSPLGNPKRKKKEAQS
ncbi:hypothetical protein BGW37DRAFT_520610 [Umbelopsis sp. PMI_123]|nr:hypothetical protein BGW37DRAFT_520610 [Umbelopsis sp. PMI_123]